jgi:hypothetical protein
MQLNRSPKDPPMSHDRLGRPLVGPCLIWTGKLPKDGYPRITRTRLWHSPQLVHRVAYALAIGHPMDAIGDIPTLDHLCRTPACSAAAHLEPTTRGENVLRGNGNQNEGKTHCDNGHEFTPENTYVRVAGTRQCRACKRISDRESYRRKNRPDLVGQPPTMVTGRPRTVFREARSRRDWQDGT